MKYLLLIYGDRTADAAPDEAMHREYGQFTQEIVESGEMLGGDALQSVETATSVRVRDGKRSTTDGPFAETKEVLGGYYYVDVKDLDRAIELAGKIPGARNGTIEVRPILELGG
ncbi:MAG TPA: YciI family protein [Acidimicrobiales bacterium]|jgi:hypothetical protein|nr:YciI family protein [Acidimicrobiales bacterium]